jgi:hypothetical protein
MRHQGAINTDIYFRINPTAVRVRQGNKGSVNDTLGGYWREVMSCPDPQYQGLLLPELTIEADTGIAHRRELKTIDWIWRHHADKKADGSPADTYYFDFVEDGPFQSVARDCPRAYLIEIMNFAWDDTVEDSYRIRFVFQCKILRDLFWEVEGGATNIPAIGNGLPTGGGFETGEAGVFAIEEVLNGNIFSGGFDGNPAGVIA